MKKAKLIIVDDAHMLTEMLATILAREPGLRVAGLAHSATEALELAGRARPDLVLLDIHMPSVSGLELVGPLRQELPAVKIIMLSAYLDPCIVHQVLESGVEGYVEKLSPLRVLREAVRCVLLGRTFFPDNFAAIKTRQLNSAEAFYKILSGREQRILQLMAAGLSDADIARHKGISTQTVATNRKRMRVKLDAHSDRELLAYARQWGLDGKGPVPPPLTAQPAGPRRAAAAGCHPYRDLLKGHLSPLRNQADRILERLCEGVGSRAGFYWRQAKPGGDLGGAGWRQPGQRGTERHEGAGMTMKKAMVAIAVIGMGGMLAAQAGSLAFTNVFARTKVEWTNTWDNVPKFDTSLGTLTQVVFSIQSFADTQFIISNASSGAESGALQTEISLYSQSGPLALGSPQLHNIDFPGDGPDGNGFYGYSFTDLAPQATISTPTYSTNLFYSHTYSDAPSLNSFKGPGTLNFTNYTFTTTAANYVNGNSEVIQDTYAGDTILISYSYIAIPEPASLVLIGMGGLAFYARRRYRQLNRKA